MGWGGDSFPSQSKAGGRLHSSPLVLWGQHLPGSSVPPDSSGTPMSWHLSKAAMGKCGAGADLRVGVLMLLCGRRRADPTLERESQRCDEAPSLGCLTCLWTFVPPPSPGPHTDVVQLLHRTLNSEQPSGTAFGLQGGAWGYDLTHRDLGQQRTPHQAFGSRMGSPALPVGHSYPAVEAMLSSLQSHSETKAANRWCYFSKYSQR